MTLKFQVQTFISHVFNYKKKRTTFEQSVSANVAHRDLYTVVLFEIMAAQGFKPFCIIKLLTTTCFALFAKPMSLRFLSY